jgi:hypothetical protein
LAEPETTTVQIPKHFLYGPIIFALIGAASGVAAAMVSRYDQHYDRVYIQESLPFAFGGAVVGLGVGCFVMYAHRWYARLRTLIEVTATALLFGCVCAVLGWLVGNKREANPPPVMFWGLLIGVALGAIYIADRWRSRRRADSDDILTASSQQSAPPSW